jgi:AcrR family transcriptional regulator
MRPGRRERVRAATIAEITETARRLLVEEGAEAVTLRAIAREMGMTAPALYRYFPSHEDLLRHLVGELYNELTDFLLSRLEPVESEGIKAKFLVAGLGFRHWALEHPREYGLLFGAPFPQAVLRNEQPAPRDHADECGARFGRLFIDLFLELWEEKPFPVTPDELIDPGLRAQLAAYRDYLQVSLPIGCLLVFLQCWILLQGAVSLEVFGHLNFALTDPEPLFHLTLHDIAHRLGLTTLEIPSGGETPKRSGG